MQRNQQAADQEVEKLRLLYERDLQSRCEVTVGVVIMQSRAYCMKHLPVTEYASINTLMAITESNH